VRKSSELNAHFQPADSNVHPNDSLLLNVKGTPTVPVHSNTRVFPDAFNGPSPQHSCVS